MASGIVSSILSMKQILLKQLRPNTVCWLCTKVLTTTVGEKMEGEGEREANKWRGRTSEKRREMERWKRESFFCKTHTLQFAVSK